MDRRTDKSNLNTALCTSASRGKKVRGIRGFEIWYLPLERQHVRMLGVSSQPISVSRSMLSTSARPASTIFVVFIDTSDVHSVAGLLWHWFMPLAPKTVTNKLQRVLNTAARVVSVSWKFDRSLTQLIHAELHHWLDVPEHFMYKLGMITRRCLNGTAPPYLAAHCVPVSVTSSRQHLRAAASHQLVVPSCWLSYGRQAFSVAGPTAWKLSTETFAGSYSHNLRLCTFTEDISFFRVVEYTVH